MIIHRTKTTPQNMTTKNPYQSVFENQIEHDTKMYDIYNHEFPALMRISQEEHVDHEYKVFHHIFSPHIHGFQKFTIAVDQCSPSGRNRFIIEAITHHGAKLIFNCTNICTTQRERGDVEIIQNGETVAIISDDSPDMYIDIMHLNIDGDDIIRSKFINIDDIYIHDDEAIYMSIDNSTIQKHIPTIHNITENIKKEHHMYLDKFDSRQTRDALGILHMLLSHSIYVKK